MKVEELIVRLHIKEDNNSSDKKMLSSSTAKANIIQHGPNLKNKGPQIIKQRG